MKRWRYALPAGMLLSAALIVVPALAQQQPRFTVMGVVIPQEGPGIAWIGEPTYTQNRLVRVQEGDSLGPYRITAIKEDRVEFVGPAGPVVVRLSASAPDVVASPSGKRVDPSVSTAPASPSYAKPSASTASRSPGSTTPAASTASREPSSTKPASSDRVAAEGEQRLLPSPVRLGNGQMTRDPREIRAYMEALKAQRPPRTGFEAMGGGR